VVTWGVVESPAGLAGPAAVVMWAGLGGAALWCVVLGRAGVGGGCWALKGGAGRGCAGVCCAGQGRGRRGMCAGVVLWGAVVRAGSKRACSVGGSACRLLLCVALLAVAAALRALLSCGALM
jgi:hypothetical protein